MPAPNRIKIRSTKRLEHSQTKGLPVSWQWFCGLTKRLEWRKTKRSPSCHSLVTFQQKIFLLVFLYLSKKCCAFSPLFPLSFLAIFSKLFKYISIFCWKDFSSHLFRNSLNSTQCMFNQNIHVLTLYIDVQIKISFINYMF